MMFFRDLTCLHKLYKRVNMLLVITTVRNVHRSNRELLPILVRHGAMQASLLRKYLNCSFQDAINIIQNKSSVLLNTTSSVLELRLSILTKTVNFDPEIIIQNPELLTIARKTIENRFSYLNDYGISVSDARFFINFRKLIMRTPKVLLSKGILRKDPVEHLFAFIDEDIARTISKRLGKTGYMSYTLTDIHKLLILHLLAIRLECTENEASKIMKQQPRLVHRSFTSLNQVILLLIEKVKLPKKGLVSNNVLLRVYPENVLRILEHPVIGGKDSLQRIRSEPEILFCNASNIAKLDEIYKKHLISELQLKIRNAYLVSPGYAEECLENVKKHKELYALKEHPLFLKMVLMLPRVETNMEVLKSQGMVSWSLSKLLMHPKDLNKNLLLSTDQCHGNEAVHLLAKILDKPKDAVVQKLYLHPLHERVSFFSVQTVVDSLLASGVSKEQVWNALYIVLYDCDLVMRTLSELETYPELSPFEEWRSSPYLLRLLIYYLEKQNIFSYTGVYLSDTATVNSFVN